MDKIEWLSRLVAYDTVSRHSNLQLIEAIETWLSHHQITSRITRDPAEPKANLFATIPAKDGNLDGGLILSGHTDVVPIDGQEWHTNPFEAVQIDDKIYGRGTCDMKGFLAVILALIPEFKKMSLPHPIHLAFSYDEEIGCRGVPLLIADMKELGINPRGCIVGEPSNMQVVIGHKGIQVFRCRVYGKAVHSSLTPEGCNSIEHAATFVTYVRALADEYSEQGPFDREYDVPFTTISTNVIQGGNAYNTIPEFCECIVGFRHLHSVNPSEIQAKLEQYVERKMLPAMQKEYENANIELIRLGSAPSFECAANHFLQDVQQLLNDTKRRKVAYATEAGLFQAAQIETIVCGPGDIKEAHRPNEFVLIEQLMQCEEFLRKVIT